MFNLYVDSIIYSMALKSPDGELSLEVVFLLYFFLIETKQEVGKRCFSKGLRKRTQQVPTTAKIIGCCWPQCCVRLHGPKSLTGFKLYATSSNKCQHCCGSMQTDTTSHNIVGPNNVGSVCMGLNA